MSGVSGKTFTDQDAMRVRMSLAGLLTDMNGFSNDLYDRLFEVAPGVRPMFSGNMDIQREKLVATLSWVAANAPKLAADTKETASSVSELKHKVRELGRRHQDLGVEAAHYDVLRGVMLDVLRARLGSGFDPATEAAWGNFYDAVAAEMIEGTPR